MDFSDHSLCSVHGRYLLAIYFRDKDGKMDLSASKLQQ